MLFPIIAENGIPRLDISLKFVMHNSPKRDNGDTNSSGQSANLPPSFRLFFQFMKDFFSQHGAIIQK